MRKVLYVNGCSHSAGSEISYPGSYREQNDLDQSFGGIVAKNYNLIHVNDALPGASNKIIQTSTIYSILNLLEKYDPSEIFVIIGWSGYDRAELIWDDQLYTVNAGTVNETNFDSYPKVIQRKMECWVETVDTRNESQNDFALTYFSVSNFLKLNKIDYFFFNAVTATALPEKNCLHPLSGNKVNQKLFSLIETDPNFFYPFDPEKTFTKYLIEKHSMFEEGRRYHFGKNAHKDWANIIIEHAGQNILKG